MLRSLFLLLCLAFGTQGAKGSEINQFKSVTSDEFIKNFEFVEEDDFIFNEDNGLILIKLENKNKLKEIINKIDEMSAFSKGGGEGGGD